jgi:hypothetical protein
MRRDWLKDELTARYMHVLGSCLGNVLKMLGLILPPHKYFYGVKLNQCQR